MLDEHCHNVASLASQFARPFKSEEWAKLLGELHDLGKARSSFQSYLFYANGDPDAQYDAAEHAHSGVGSCLAVQKYRDGGWILAYVIAGHHAGLPDWIGGETPNGSLCVRLSEEKHVLEEKQLSTYLKDFSLPSQLPAPPMKFGQGREMAFWIRMLYSCLVDADFLDTEAFMDPDQANGRGGYPELSTLAEMFFKQLDAQQQQAPKTSVNAIRAEIRSACERAALDVPGLFSLTVPTGGGKTLSTMAFAFRHALKYGKRRIIYVIPYTSIIEQTADELRRFLGAENVLEHHSNFDPEKETQRSRLASENWDAPVIVTTTVQFFESLYACKSSRCRKLHNIAESVVILDEVQLLPTNLLMPCVWALQDLVSHYGSTIVLSTATQPKLSENLVVREIIPSTLDLYNRMKRTEWTLPEPNASRMSWNEVAEELQKFPQVLCVVNTRRDCRELFELMPPGTIHLSASMCGEHRSRVIKQIKLALSSGDPIRVVSTQLVEAGVDIDFPVVYRAFTGLSSIAQSAGRCNREGRLSCPGRVVVFLPPREGPRGVLRYGEYATSDVLRMEDRPSLDAPETFPLYFSKLLERVHSLGGEFDEWLSKNARAAVFSRWT